MSMACVLIECHCASTELLVFPTVSTVIVSLLTILCVITDGKASTVTYTVIGTPNTYIHTS